MRNEDAVQIGWYNLKEDHVFCDRGYECAAWYENINVKAGKYPIMVHDYRTEERDEGTEIDGHIGGAYIRMDGTIVDDYFGSLFCGVPIGTYDCKKNEGKGSRYTMFARLYSIADSVLNDPETPYELFQNYEAKEIKFMWDGEEHKTHGIFLTEGSDASCTE